MKIRFSEGYYETEDKEEIRQLGKQSAVVEAPVGFVAPREYGDGGVAVEGSSLGDPSSFPDEAYAPSE